MKILACITHVDEVTLSLTHESLLNQTVKADAISIIRNVCPMRAAMNEALDQAHNYSGVDLLFLVNGDTILEPTTLEELVRGYFLSPEELGEILDRRNNDFIVATPFPDKRPIEKDSKIVSVFCYSKDIIKGMGTGGVTLFDMHIIRDKYRFGMGLIADMNFYHAICQETAGIMVRANKVLTTHHPVWLPHELWMRIRFSLPKYRNNPLVIKQHKDFFDQELLKDPDNPTLVLPFAQFNTMMEQGLENFVLHEKDPRELQKEWDVFRQPYTLTGDEFFAMDGYKEVAKKLLAKRLS